MDSQDSFVSRLPVTDDQKNALLYAFYNTLLFTLLGICLASIFAVYQMLYMFLMPILWASLVGTVLFPLKRLISASLKAWLEELDELDRPLLVGLAFLPVQSTLRISNYIYETALSFTGFCIAIGYASLKFLCYYDAFTTLLNWISRFYSTVDLIIGFYTLKSVFILALLYAIGFGSWIYLQEVNKINKKFARVVSLPIWIFLLARFSDLFGPLRVLFFTFSCAMLALISGGLIDHRNNHAEMDEQIQPEQGNDANKAEDGTQTQVQTAISTESRLDQALSSDAHLRIICGLCALLFVVNHDSLLFLLLIPFAVALLIDIGNRMGLSDFFWNSMLSAKQRIAENGNKFVHIVVAGPLRKYVSLLFTSDKMFINGLMARIDLISSIVVMVALALGSLIMLLFTVFMLHGETVHLVKLGGNVLSSNPDWLRYAMNYTGSHLGEHDLDNYMEQAYQHGRSWLASNFRSLADPKDPTRADQLEEQAKLLVDNLYRLWEERGQRIFEEPLAMDQAVQRRADYSSADEELMAERGGSRQWFSRLLRNTNLGLWKGVFTENLEMVWAISQSLWHVLLMNISLLATILITMLGLLLGFGFELLNFLIECVVFLTAVYYLLANSADQWLPLRWVNDFSVSLQINALTSEANHQVDVARAVEGAISGVFVLSTKMAIFYGLYTYFVHSLFTLNVVFIPSALAALLAAIPIFPPYSVALFGVVELWLVRGEPVAALVFACASVAPLFFADPAFYREVKGSHPYITGLAVVGGIYWLGLQGAIIGPILLCLAIALLNVYAEFANHRNRTPSDSRMNY